MNQTLEEIIRQYVALNPPNTKGWETCLHIGCDHGKKGLRAAYIFNDDVVAFHCFNCGVKTGYNPAEHDTMPKAMRQVLDDFGIPEQEWKQVIFNNLTFNKKDKTKQLLDIIPKEIELPEEFYNLKDTSASNVLAKTATQYLKDRFIDPDSYPFMLYKKGKNPLMWKWTNRIIIPIYKDSKLIYYQGRDLYGTAIKKYESPSKPKDKVIFGFDKLFLHSTAPLFITEGWFDAHLIDGIAIMGNELTKPHIEWINKSKRNKVYIPDLQGDGRRTGEKALEAGWSITVPEIPGCKDVTDAFKKYGEMYTLQSLMSNISNGFKAQLLLKIFVDQGKSKVKKTFKK